MYSKYQYIFAGLLFSIFSLTSCDKEDPITVNEEELITTVNLTFTPNGGGDVVVLSFKDLDGDGGNAPLITGGTLSASTTYTGSIELLNEAESPAENITEEIEEEDEDHQFFYAASGTDLDISYADVDGNGQPIGLLTNITSGNASSGTLTVTLRHEPEKLASGVVNGLIENAGGETDIEVAFPITIQ